MSFCLEKSKIYCEALENRKIEHRPKRAGPEKNQGMPSRVFAQVQRAVLPALSGPRTSSQVSRSLRFEDEKGASREPVRELVDHCWVQNINESASSAFQALCCRTGA